MSSKVTRRFGKLALGNPEKHALRTQEAYTKKIAAEISFRGVPGLHRRAALFVQSSNGKIQKMVERYILLRSRLSPTVESVALEFFLRTIVRVHGKGKGFLFLEELKKKAHPEAEVYYNGTIQAFSALSNLLEVQKLVGEAEQKKITVSPRALMSLRETAVQRNVEDVFEMFKSIQAEKREVSDKLFFRIFRGYVTKRGSKAAMEMLTESEKSDVIKFSDPHFCNGVLQVLLDESEDDLMLKLYTRFVRRGFKPDNSTIGILCRSKNVHILARAEGLLNRERDEKNEKKYYHWQLVVKNLREIGEMKKAKHLEDTKLTSAIAKLPLEEKLYGRGRPILRRNDQEAVREFADEQERRRFSSKELTLERLLVKCCRVGDMELGKKYLRQAALLKVPRTKRTHKAIAELLIRCGKSSSAHSYVRHLKLVSSSTNLVEAVELHSLSLLADKQESRTLGLMVKEAPIYSLLQHPHITAKIMRKLASDGKLDDCYDLFGKLKSESEFSFHVSRSDIMQLYGGLMLAHSTQNDIEGVERLRRRMEREGLVYDQAIYVRMMHMYADLGSYEKGLECYNDCLKLKNVEPRVYTAGARLYSNMGDLQGLIETYKRFRAKGLRPKEPFFEAALDLMGRKHVDKQIKLNFMRWCRQEMEELGIKGTTTLYTNAMTFYLQDRRSHNALQLYNVFRQENSMKPSPRLITLALIACAKRKNVTAAQMVLEDARMAHLKLGPKQHEKLAQLYAKVGKFEEALRYFDLVMSAKGVAHPSMQRLMASLIESNGNPALLGEDSLSNPEQWVKRQERSVQVIAHEALKERVTNASIHFNAVQDTKLNQQHLAAMASAYATTENLRGLKKFLLTYEDRPELLGPVLFSNTLKTLHSAAGMRSGVEFLRFLIARLPRSRDAFFIALEYLVKNKKQSVAFELIQTKFANFRTKAWDDESFNDGFRTDYRDILSIFAKDRERLPEIGSIFWSFKSEQLLDIDSIEVEVLGRSLSKKKLVEYDHTKKFSVRKHYEDAQLAESTKSEASTLSKTSEMNHAGMKEATEQVKDAGKTGEVASGKGKKKKKSKGKGEPIQTQNQIPVGIHDDLSNQADRTMEAMVEMTDGALDSKEQQLTSPDPQKSNAADTNKNQKKKKKKKKQKEVPLKIKLNPPKKKRRNIVANNK